jgi:carboxymethylenebutenolidase
MDRIYVMELVRSYQVGTLSRRTFLRRATVALGSVAAANVLLAACMPVTGPTAPVVVAPTAAAAQEPAAAAPAGLVTGNVEYPGPNGETLTGYLARPEGDGPWPAVLVIQEWWGLNEHIKDVTNRLAAEGYVALAPDLYHGVSTSEPNEARKLVMELDMAAAVEEIGSAMDHVLAQEYAAGETGGIVGFCMGGRLALMSALSLENLGAVVPFYGSPLTPEEAATVTVPVLGLYGELDAGIPVREIRLMDEALQAAGTPVEVVIYEGAQHAFFNDTRPDSYNAEASADAWPRMLAWFETYLK